MIHNWNNNAKRIGQKVIQREEFVVDDATDIDNLPDETEALPGSIAMCIGNKKMYILNSSGTWVEQ